jgi:hypothetical protein
MAFSGALVRKASDQTLANYTTVTSMAFDNEVYDVGGWHDNVTNNSRLTVPSGVSRVRLIGQVGIALWSANSWMYMDILKNGGNANPIVADLQYGSVSNPRMQIVSPVFDASPGDYFQLRFQVGTDTSITITAAETWFGIEAVG